MISSLCTALHFRPFLFFEIKRLSFFCNFFH
jgi:hypothetical protein